MKTVAISILGTKLDHKRVGNKRWQVWRPNIGICQQDNLAIDKIVLLYHAKDQTLFDLICADIATIKPEIEIDSHVLSCTNLWDFEQVYSDLFDFAKGFDFDHESEKYLIHITTGTHVAQICLYLLTEANYLPGKLLQSSPLYGEKDPRGTYQIIDLNLSKYDQIGSRFKQEHTEGSDYLKQGIETRNAAFNSMIAQIEKVSVHSRAPILLTGPTGAGKSQLANRIYELKKHRGHVFGKLVTVNCATLQGELAMSALFGHAKGAFNGANATRKGLLREANGGILFLDEIAELGLKEQSMLLRAIEEKKFLPVGSDQERSSDFELIASTHHDLTQMVQQGRFKKELLSRIHVWTYHLPSLRSRIEDLEPNLDFELKKYSELHNSLVRFNKDARLKYLNFALAASSSWDNNFRDLNASVGRMAALSAGGRITESVVNMEIKRLKQFWHISTMIAHSPADQARAYLDQQQVKCTDLYDLLLLGLIIDICKHSDSLADAGRKLFNHSRLIKKTQNDSHRLKQILQKYHLTFEKIQQE